VTKECCSSGVTLGHTRWAFSKFVSSTWSLPWRVWLESPAQSIYELSVAKGGAKLKKAEANDKLGRRIGRGQLGGTTPLPVLATSLSQSLDRPVVDKTGLLGNFSFTLTYTPEVGDGNRLGPPAADAPPTDSSGPSIFTALREQLGLELKSARGPVETARVNDSETLR